MSNRTDWFYEAKFGLFVHWTTHSMPCEGEKKPHAEAIRDFQLDKFVSQIVESGAKFVFFTITHADMNVPFPLSELDEIMEGLTSEYDLISELADRLEPHGIRLMFYFNGEGSTTPNYMEVTKFWEDPSYHAEICYKLTEAISRRYGKKIHGWWIDCCYEPPICKGRGTRYDYKRYAEALRAGNPDSIVAFNFRGVEPWGCDWGKGISDFQAGEENDIIHLPNGRFSGEGDTQWFGLCWMDDFWVHEKIGEPTPMHDNEKVLDYINKVKACGGVFAYNVAPYQEGFISEKTMEQLRYLKEHGATK